MTYEETIKRLAEIVALLEAGRQSLNDSLALFEEGVRLAHDAMAQLRVVEARAQELMAQADGTFRLVEIGQPSR